MRKELIANIVTFASVLIIGSLILGFGYLGLRPGTKYTNLTFALGNTSQLTDKSPVLLRGVPVGEVTKVNPRADGVDITVRYSTQYRIPTNSAITIEQLSAMGEPYLEIAPRTDASPYFTDGTTVAASAITQPMTIPEVFRALASVNRAAQVGPVGDLLETAAQATADTDDDMPKLRQAGNLLAATISDRMPGIRTMFANTQQYSADMDWLPQTMTALGTEFRSTTTTIRDAVEQVQKMILALDSPKPFNDTLHPFLDRLQPYLDELLPSLANTSGPFLAILSAVTRTLPQIDLSSLLSNALQTVSPAGTTRLTITVPTPR